MSKKSKSLSRKTAAPSEVRAQLLRIGKEHFLAYGAQKLCVRQVVKEAGVNLGSFVYYFGSKESFLEQIILAHYANFLEIFNIEFEKIQALKTSSEKLAFMFERMAHLICNSSCMLARFLMDILQGEKTILRAFNNNPPPHSMKLIQLIADGQKSGEFRKDFSPRMGFILCLFSIALPQALFMQVESKFKSPRLQPLLDEILDEKMIKKRIDFALRGLKK